jgi:hypothetical protein
MYFVWFDPFEKGAVESDVRDPLTAGGEGYQIRIRLLNDTV